MSTQEFEGDRRAVVVTGGTGGIGRAVARDLAGRGYRVLIVGRDARRGAEVLSSLGSDGHVMIRADLALLRETSRAADEILAASSRLDAVVLCAGVLATRPEWTDEDLERTLALNHLSRHLLLRRLSPLLGRAPSGRVVLVANAGKYRDTLNLDDLQMRRGGRGLRVAGRTQFANDLLAVELAERLEPDGIAVTCVYPGPVATDVFRNARGVPGPVRELASAVQHLIGRTPEVAARTPVALVTGPAVSGFFGPRTRRRRIPARASDPARRAALWAASEALAAPWLEPVQRRPGALPN